jgi:hypothetical protein
MSLDRGALAIVYTGLPHIPGKVTLAGAMEAYFSSCYSRMQRF